MNCNRTQLIPLYQPLPPLFIAHSSQLLGLRPLDNHIVADQERTEQFLKRRIRLERIQTLRESLRQRSRDAEVLSLRVGEGRRVVCLSLVNITFCTQ